MNANMNDISGFDAMSEEVRKVYVERDQLRKENEDLKMTLDQFREGRGALAKDILDGIHCTYCDLDNTWMLEQLAKDKVKRLYDGRKRQEEFTEEAASTLGVNLNDLSLSDVLDALRKLKRCEELDDMNSSIIADLKEERDKLQQDYLNEIGRRKTAERYISDSLSKICSALSIEYSTDTTLEYILDTIDDLKARSLEFNLRTENFRHLCDILGLEPKDTIWANIFNEVEDLRAKYLNLCGDFACCCDKLGLDSTERNRHDAMVKIADLKSRSLEFNLRKENFKKLCDLMDLEPNHTTWQDIYDEIEKLKGWKTVAADHDKRRKNWVRKYKSEHERANSCDELYKKYKALYDAGAPERKKLSDDLETYRSSYEAVKNTATKNRSLMNTVANIVGTVGMHDDVTLTGVLNARKKANHWDILVDGYGEGTVRSLLENINVDVSGDKGNGLF